MDASDVSGARGVQRVIAMNDITDASQFRIVCREIPQGCGVLSIRHRECLHEGGVSLVVFVPSVVMIIVTKGGERSGQRKSHVAMCCC